MDTTHEINTTNAPHDGTAISIKKCHKITDTDILQIKINTITGLINIAATYHHVDLAYPSLIFIDWQTKTFQHT